MHLGVLSTIGSRRNASIIHVVIDNEAYESTGCQRTTAATTSFAAAAVACGYQSGCECHNAEALREAVRRALATGGSHMIVAKVECSASEPPSIMASRAPEDLAAGFRRSFSALRAHDGRITG
jgi:phosphonopyruvate decarboxylase